jgi:membrane protein
MGEPTTNRRIGRGVIDGFAEHDLLTYASAICFQILTAVVPLLMFATALLGFLHLNDAWTQHIAPQVEDATSSQAFALIDDAVRRVLTHQQLTWLTLGLALTVWEASGGIRATMDVLSRIYGGRDDRPRGHRYAVSFALSLLCTALVVIALALVFVTPEVLPGIGWAVLRWPAAFLALLTFVWLLMRFAPCHPTPVHWVSFGAVVSAGSWLIATGAFAFYVRNIAAYGTLFGGLAVVFVTFLYLYLSVCALLAGAQVDALIREERTGSLSGTPAAQCGSSPVANGGRDSSASEVIVSGPRAAAERTSLASSGDRA